MNRGNLLDNGIIEILEQAVKNAYLELCMEQWLHSLYIPSHEFMRVQTKESELVKYMNHLIHLSVAPPSMVCEVIQHVLNTQEYFNHFAKQVLSLSHMELLAACRPKKEQPEFYDPFETKFIYRGMNGDVVEFKSLEEFSDYLDSGFSFEQVDFEQKAEEGSVHSEIGSSDFTTHSEGVKERVRAQSEISRGEKEKEREDCGSANLKNSSPTQKAPASVGRKFNHYSFGIHKTQFVERECLEMIVRLKSNLNNEKIEGSVNEIYNKLNASQSGSKKASNDTGGDRPFFLPIRRFMVSVEVNRNEVRVLSYNLKEEVQSKIIEKVSEEVTFHEMRETLIYGLSNKKAMASIIKNGTTDFENRLTERTESLNKKNMKRRHEIEIDLKYSKSIRLGFDRSKMAPNSTPTLSLTAMVVELIKRPNNGELPKTDQIRYSHRGEVKQLMQKIVEMITVSYSKIKKENLNFCQDVEPTLIRPDWGDDLGQESECESESDSLHSMENKNGRNSNLAPIKIKYSHSIQYPDQSFHSENMQNEEPSTESGNPLPSAISPILTHQPNQGPGKNSFEMNFKKGKHLTASLQHNTQPLDEESEMESENHQIDYEKLEGSKSGISEIHTAKNTVENLSQRSKYIAIDRSLLNIKKLEDNFSLHLFDHKIRKLFDFGDSTFTSYEELKKKLNKVVTLELPVYYFDKGGMNSTIEMERMDSFQMRGDSYSDTFLNLFTSHMKVDDIKNKFKLVLLNVEEKINAGIEFLTEPAIENNPFYRQFFCPQMREFIMTKASPVMLYAAISAEKNPNSILFIDFAITNLMFQLNIYRFVPVKFKGSTFTDTIPNKIARHIKLKVFSTHFDYINKDFPGRNPKCNFKLMEASLFNSSKILKMDISHKAFFINIKIPLSVVTKQSPSSQTIEQIKNVLREIKISKKSKLPIETRDIETEETKKIFLEYSMYDIDQFYSTDFPDIQRFVLKYSEIGELKESTLEQEEPCLDYFVFLNLTGVKLVPSTQRDQLSEQIVSQMKRELDRTFAVNVKKNLFKSGIRLDGPIMFNFILKLQHSAFSTQSSKHAKYYFSVISNLSTHGIDGNFIISSVSEAFPEAFEVSEGDERYLLINYSLVSKMIYQIKKDRLKEVYIYRPDDAGFNQTELDVYEEHLSKGFNILMSSLWAIL